jgi:hypothetical protein
MKDNTWVSSEFERDWKLLGDERRSGYLQNDIPEEMIRDLLEKYIDEQAIEFVSVIYDPRGFLQKIHHLTDSILPLLYFDRDNCLTHKKTVSQLTARGTALWGINVREMRDDFNDIKKYGYRENGTGHLGSSSKYDPMTTSSDPAVFEKLVSFASKLDSTCFLYFEHDANPIYFVKRKYCIQQDPH